MFQVTALLGLLQITGPVANNWPCCLTLPSMILSGPPGPLGGCLVIVLDSTVSPSRVVDIINTSGSSASCCYWRCSKGRSLLVRFPPEEGFEAVDRWCIFGF